MIQDEKPTLAKELAAQVESFLADHPASGSDSAEFLGARFDAGFAWVDQPVGLGGLGLDPRWQEFVEERFVLSGAAAPDPNRNIIGLGMAAPTIMACATPEQQRRWLRPLWTGEEEWCQLFSEPGAGSDLAGVATRAVRTVDGDWAVNGQKVWTSLAHQARWGLLLARTDPDVPKHRGLTYFMCDMRADGIDVRPLRQLTGEAEFNEVFLTDVAVHDVDRVGEVGEGWKVAMATLASERVLFAQEQEPRGSGLIGRLLADWRAGGGAPYLEHDLVDLWIEAEALRLFGNRLVQSRESGPGAEGSGFKLAAAEFQQAAASFWVELAGEDGLRYSDWTMRRPAYHDPATRDPGYGFLRTRANSIEGGTTQIMRNIIAERVLGLPEETRVDRDVPWREVPR